MDQTITPQQIDPILWQGRVYIEPSRRPRARVRCVSASDPARAVARARAAGRAIITARHGGDVPNSYGYPAATDVRLEVAFPEGAFVSWAGSAPANKVTLGGAAEAARPGARPIFDRRFSAQRAKEAHMEVLRRAQAVLAARGQDAPELTAPGPEEIRPEAVAAILDRVGPAGEQCQADERRYRLHRRYARTALVASDGTAALLGYQGGDYAVLVVRDATSGERHVLRVPPETATRSGTPDEVIHAAVAWTFRMSPEGYHPDVAA